MLILGLIVFGLLVGWLAQLALGKPGLRTDWTLALVAGLLGSFVGGLVLSMIAGDGLRIRPSGLIGSFIGAVIVTVVWQRFLAPPGGPEPPAAVRLVTDAEADPQRFSACAGSSFVSVGDRRSVVRSPGDHAVRSDSSPG